MAKTTSQRLRTVSLLLLLTASLSACNAVTRIAQVGTAPPITPIQNPTQEPGYRVVSLPMPDASTDRFMSNSLWRQGARAFFKDQRANRVGDILTVLLVGRCDAQRRTVVRPRRARSSAEHRASRSPSPVADRTRGPVGSPARPDQTNK